MLSQETIDIIKSTVPVLEEHGKTITTVFYKNMFEAHPELLNVFNHANQSQGRQQTALANTVYAAAANIDNLEAILPAVIQIAHKHKSLGITEDQYPIVGYHLLGAIKEVLGDAATPEIISAWGEAYGVIADVFISVEKEMYEQAEAMEGGWRTFKAFTVADKVVESDVITSFYLKPVDGNQLPSYLPGQYITVRVNIPGEEYTLNRQYSLSQALEEDVYRISVKREDECEPNGKVSTYLHRNVNVGDEIEVSVPAGDFYLDPESTTPVTLISGGVGITPMMSMYETIARISPERPVAFLHSARTRAHQAFNERITELDASLENSSVAVLYSEEGDGFITKDFLQEKVLEGSDIYVCGPTPFMQAVINYLYELGHPEEKVHYEFFGPKAELELVTAS
ncbi:NO-inducible flavohemoprotein [Sporosarcina pasteurii]|uniref:Flavohemoprotein n=1 Tax=Sporosarcina pasteurii TaxID=1474 RepID=A0A380CI63_SPOPA|nr:NO-inducible flavohemoprotein [Sporosarcina pasteurii]MDS9472130.1 NO-inducible flavohemoprotein [Sporosarcina pasteurii]QBQ06845.1 NO-inducible flavohemoprotein [Sporosarcina pasteurii]SUJ20437.1 Nitric oxide dioxygenase [Sporosarcina pasteurii]